MHSNGNNSGMKTRLHKILPLVGVIFSVIIALIALTACDSCKQQKLAKECVRIHIRANSNSAEDQSVKLAVRDEITAYLQDVLEGCGTKSDAQKRLAAEQRNLVEIANKTLYLHNFDYKASIRINNEYFPDRNYDGYDFPAGYYDAVIIELGTGEGDNWWCVAFPPLCFVPSAQNGEKIVYKSWIKETLDKLFGNSK